MKAKAELTSGVIRRKLVARFVRMTVDDSSVSIAFATREADREAESAAKRPMPQLDDGTSGVLVITAAGCSPQPTPRRPRPRPTRWVARR
jgi:hypothetical protein